MPTIDALFPSSDCSWKHTAAERARACQIIVPPIIAKHPRQASIRAPMGPSEAPPDRCAAEAVRGFASKAGIKVRINGSLRHGLQFRIPLPHLGSSAWIAGPNSIMGCGWGRSHCRRAVISACTWSDIWKGSTASGAFQVRKADWNHARGRGAHHCAPPILAGSRGLGLHALPPHPHKALGRYFGFAAGGGAPPVGFHQTKPVSAPAPEVLLPISLVGVVVLLIPTSE